MPEPVVKYTLGMLKKKKHVLQTSLYAGLPLPAGFGLQWAGGYAEGMGGMKMFIGGPWALRWLTASCRFWTVVGWWVRGRKRRAKKACGKKEKVTSQRRKKKRKLVYSQKVRYRGEGTGQFFFFKFQISIGQGWGPSQLRPNRPASRPAPALAN